MFLLHLAPRCPVSSRLSSAASGSPCGAQLCPAPSGLRHTSTAPWKGALVCQGLSRGTWRTASLGPPRCGRPLRVPGHPEARMLAVRMPCWGPGWSWGRGQGGARGVPSPHVRARRSPAVPGWPVGRPRPGVVRQCPSPKNLPRMSPRSGLAEVCVSVSARTRLDTPGVGVCTGVRACVHATTFQCAQWSTCVSPPESSHRASFQGPCPPPWCLQTPAPVPRAPPHGRKCGRQHPRAAGAGR